MKDDIGHAIDFVDELLASLADAKEDGIDTELAEQYLNYVAEFLAGLR